MMYVNGAGEVVTTETVAFSSCDSEGHPIFPDFLKTAEAVAKVYEKTVSNPAHCVVQRWDMERTDAAGLPVMISTEYAEQFLTIYYDARRTVRRPAMA